MKKLLVSIIILTFSIQSSIAAVDFPNLDPIAFHIFSIPVRWYGLFYLFGLIGSSLIAFYLLHRDSKATTTQNSNLTFEDFLNAAINSFLIGIIGGRLGYVLFYNLDYYLGHPIEILMLNKGGMSFHGGLIGGIVGLWISTRKKKNFWDIADLGATVFPFALLLGRFANFINGELWGRVTTVPWAVKFPTGGFLPRHPSQIYEALLEGALLLVILLIVRSLKIPAKGLQSGIFVMGYGISRFIVEFFRQPDVQIGFIAKYFTTGQLLSLPMIIVGLYIIMTAKTRFKKLQNKTNI